MPVQRTFLSQVLTISLLLSGLLMALARPARAHDTPFSYLDLRLTATGATALLEAPAVDLAHDFADLDAATLMSPQGAQRNGERLLGVVRSRLIVEDGATALPIALTRITPLPDKKSVRMELALSGAPASSRLNVRCRLFPYDPRHRTFLNIYDDGKLKQQIVFDKSVDRTEYTRGRRQSGLDVVREFLVQGVYHIFTGPDHILFIVGLLLLGGKLMQLLKIVTAFTIAHSITLALATLNVVNPPARLIEPTIALSIVFVGIHSLLPRKDQRDPRLIFAFVFGFIHGFGFANALREMELPHTALVLSLFSFNLGVEFGQMCIVLTVAPLLAALHRYNELAARRFVLTASVVVILAGAFWFVQRLFTA